MAYQIVDLSDIVDAVVAELKLDPNDTNELIRIKRDINKCYLGEVVPFKRDWKWLRGTTNLRKNAYIASGTVAVTPSSATITFSTAPSISLTGYFFAIDNYNEIYTISSHTAASTTATLSSTFTGTLSSAADYKVWTDKVLLPTDCAETIEVWHDHYSSNMEAVGLQEFRRRVQESPRANAYPALYTTQDFEDPTPLTDETESDRYRVMYVYPAICEYSTTLHVDYKKEVGALEDDSDEPVMPVTDRIVLVYGALEMAWRRARNPEEAANNRMLFERKLAQMAGRLEDSFDTPQLTPSSNYISKKRARAFSQFQQRQAFSGGGAYTVPSYLENTTINGATISGNVTVNSGITIDGRDISVDGATLDALNTLANGYIYVGNASNVAAEVAVSGDITLSNAGVAAIASGVIVNADINASAAIARTKLASGTADRVVIEDGSGNLSDSAITSTELTVLDDQEPLTSFAMSDNQSSAANVATWTAASFDSLFVRYSIARGAANREVGLLMITTDGTNASIAQSVTSIGTIGVTFTVDISSGSLRLRYTSTSTGTAPSMKYRVEKWLA